MPPLKCPNPTCNFLFDPSMVPTGAVLQCPRCRKRFSLAQSAPPPEFLAVKSDGPAPRGRGLTSYLLPVMAVMVVVGGVLAAVMLSGGKTHPRGTGDIRSDTLNFSFTPPGSPWQPDEDVKTNRLGVNVAVFH